MFTSGCSCRRLIEKLELGHTERKEEGVGGKEKERGLEEERGGGQRVRQRETEKEHDIHSMAYNVTFV